VDRLYIVIVVSSPVPLMLSGPESTKLTGEYAETGDTNIHIGPVVF